MEDKMCRSDWSELARRECGGLCRNSTPTTMGAYRRQALKTCKDEDREKALSHHALGVAGEAGEVADHVKKYLHHGRNLDTDAVIDELGDVLWHLTALADAVGSSLEQVALRNVEKLQARYPDGFEEGGGMRRLTREELTWVTREDEK
jgi:NTP pyrophosphatase (non-canonical NTP hydrolase)